MEIIKMNKKYDIVIARYNESLNWLQQVDLTNVERVFVYNKNITPYKLSFSIRPDITVINLPNVGRESHTYLYHIVKYYETEDFSDKIMFVQGNFLEHIQYNDLLKGNNFHESSLKQLDGFRLRYYKTKLRPNKLNKNAIEWAKIYIDPEIDVSIKKYGHYVRYGACFSIDKRSILSRSYRSYNTLLSTVSDHSNPEEGHFFERTWYYIFNMHKINYDLPPTNYMTNNFSDDMTYSTNGYIYICSYCKLNKGQMVQISFKTPSDAHIGLSDQSTRQFFEIVIGGWNNKNSCIRTSKQGSNIVFINNQYCDANKFKKIYIKLYTKILVYDESMKIMMESNTITNDSFTVYFSSWDKYSCEWKIKRFVG